MLVGHNNQAIFFKLQVIYLLGIFLNTRDVIKRVSETAECIYSSHNNVYC